MYRIRSNYPFYRSLKICSLFFNYPQEDNANYLRKLYLKLFVTKAVAFIAIVVGGILHLYHCIKENLPVDLSEDISIIIGVSFTALTPCLFMINSKEWSNIFNDLSTFSRFGRPKNFDSTITTLNKFATYFFIFIIFGVLGYAAACIYDKGPCEELNIKLNLTEICLSTPIWIPFDVEVTTEGKWAIMVVQIISGWILTTPSGFSCFLVYESTEIVITHLQFLKEIALQFGNENMTQEESIERIKLWVQYHNRLLRTSGDMNKVFQRTTGHVSIVAGLICGCMCNQILKTKPLGAFIFLVGWVFSLFLICHAGQRIRDEMESIGDAVYCSQWYNLKPTLKKDISFIILMTQRPVNFSALPVGVLDYPLFVMVMKTAYSYLTLLTQTTQTT